MEFYEVIKKRRSIRKFKNEKIPDEMLERILESARLAPTWANMQGVRFIIIDNPEQLEKIKDAIGQNWTKSAPYFITVCIEPRKSGKNKNGLEYFMVDAAICMEHIILAATNEGLGTCWIGYFDEDKIKQILNIPKKVRVIALTPIGIPDQEPKTQERKKLEEIVFKNNYEQKWK